MSATRNTNVDSPELVPNGPAAAAILAAGIGSFALALTTVLADRSAAFKLLLTFSKPVGPLSGVTTIAIVLWIAGWIFLDLLWKRRELPLARIGWVAIVLFALSLLLTFPPLADLL
jgi:hypothetical protein